MSHSLSITIQDNVVTCAIAGRIDGQTAPHIQSQLVEKLDDATFAVFEVSQVEYMSSAGFRLLLLFYRSLSLKGGRLALVGLVDEIRETMEMTGFLDFFLLHDTVEEALQQVQNHANYASAH